MSITTFGAEHNALVGRVRSKTRSPMDLFSTGWQNLYEASVHSLQSDDDEPNLVHTQQPFYLKQQPQPSIEKPCGNTIGSR